MPLSSNLFNSNAKVLNIFQNKGFYGWIYPSSAFFVPLKGKKALFEEYKNHPDESVRERTTNWATAIGLQCVDGLNVSDFLIQVARQENEGKITMDEAQILIDEHYEQNRF